MRKRIDSSPVLKPVYNLPKARLSEQVRLIYFILLTRQPTEEEQKLVASYTGASGDPARAARDLAWALINSKEFLYRH